MSLADLGHRIRQADRCDRCGAQAFAFATIIDVRLFFCGHHFAMHEPAIYLIASEVVDERHRLTLNTTPDLKGAPA